MELNFFSIWCFKVYWHTNSKHLLGLQIGDSNKEGDVCGSVELSEPQHSDTLLNAVQNDSLLKNTVSEQSQGN